MRELYKVIKSALTAVTALRHISNFFFLWVFSRKKALPLIVGTFNNHGRQLLPMIILPLMLLATLSAVIPIGAKTVENPRYICCAFLLTSITTRSTPISSWHFLFSKVRRTFTSGFFLRPLTRENPDLLLLQTLYWSRRWLFVGL